MKLDPHGNSLGGVRPRTQGAAAGNALGLSSKMSVLQIILARTRSQKRYSFGKQQVTI
jgi:hypothetical protein